VPSLDVLKRLLAGLTAMGSRRLVALGLSGVTVFLLVAISGYLLNRPQQEVLYSGLDAQDVTRMGAALDDAGVAFDVNVDGDAVMVEYGQAAKARMLLAQKGLPRSDTSGYELFDKLGSLGLTTFMQQVTRVRALEGELARTIQLIDGIRAARVHLALRNEGSFRSTSERATASVIIRTDEESGRRAANAIQHLVAAAIPGLSPDHVTVMSADGSMLTSTDDAVSAAPEKLIGLERTLASDIESKIARTFSPYLGAGHFRISVSAKLNADRRQISETAFDPNSRVERSVRTIKESGEAENATGAAGVTVEQNIPVEETPKSNGDNSREKKDRKEELTNYEINSKSISTTSEGYGIDRLSVAVIINRAQIVRMLGASPAEEAISAKVNELQQLATSAAGLVESRGDSMKLTAVDFIAEDEILTPVEGVGVFDLIGGNLGNLINAGTLLLVSLLVLLLGLRPAIRTILNQAALSPPAMPAGAIADGSTGNGSSSLPGSAATSGRGTMPQLHGFGQDPVLESLAREVSGGPRDRLSKIVELDPERAAQVLKEWLSDPIGTPS
jgi:flagellar M-ring protein FliF